MMILKKHNRSINKIQYFCVMIKKIIAYNFILIANLVLLVYTVLPHHHHEQQVCVDDVAIHTHSANKHNHQHNNTDSSTCLLKQAVIISSSQGKFLKSCDNCTDKHNHEFFILSNIGFGDLQPISVTEENVPKFQSFLISFVTTSIGLRAPPIV